MFPAVFALWLMAIGSVRTTLLVSSFYACHAYQLDKVDSFVKCLRDNVIQIACVQECAEEKWEILYYNTILNYNYQTCTGTSIILRQDIPYSNLLMHPNGKLISLVIKGMAIVCFTHTVECTTRKNTKTLFATGFGSNYKK